MLSFNLNPLHIECTLFFQENPYTFETIQGLSFRLGRNIDDLQNVLDQLVKNMVLEVIGTGESAIYRYVQPMNTALDEEEPWNEI